MIVRKGSLVRVDHSRHGAFTARASETFNTEREVFFPLTLEDDALYGHGYDRFNRQFLRAFELLENERHE